MPLVTDSQTHRFQILLASSLYLGLIRFYIRFLSVFKFKFYRAIVYNSDSIAYTMNLPRDVNITPRDKYIALNDKKDRFRYQILSVFRLTNFIARKIQI